MDQRSHSRASRLGLPVLGALLFALLPLILLSQAAHRDNHLERVCFDPQTNSWIPCPEPKPTKTRVPALGATRTPPPTPTSTATPTPTAEATASAMGGVAPLPSAISPGPVQTASTVPDALIAALALAIFGLFAFVAWWYLRSRPMPVPKPSLSEAGEDVRGSLDSTIGDIETDLGGQHDRDEDYSS